MSAMEIVHISMPKRLKLKTSPGPFFQAAFGIGDVDLGARLHSQSLRFVAANRGTKRRYLSPQFAGQNAAI